MNLKNLTAAFPDDRKITADQLCAILCLPCLPHFVGRELGLSTAQIRRIFAMGGKSAEWVVEVLDSKAATFKYKPSRHFMKKMQIKAEHDLLLEIWRDENRDALKVVTLTCADQGLSCTLSIKAV